MRRSGLVSVLALFIGAVAAGVVWAEGTPTVAIVKADNMELALNDVKINWDRTFVQGVTEGRKMDVIRVEWSKEGEAYIEQLVRQAVALAGNWPVKKGDVVLLKPNFVVTAFDMFECQARTNPEMQAHVTDVRILRALAKLAHESGASRILVGEGTRGGHDYTALQQWGVEAMAEDLAKEGIKVELVPFNEQPVRWVKAPFGLANKEYALPEVVVKDVDVLINVPGIKSHTVAGVTIGLKNTAVGLPSSKVYGSPKLALPHMAFAEWATDLNAIRKKEGRGTRMIDYTVVDALWGAEGDQGCAWGGPGAFPVKLGLIIAGSDPVAVDTVGTAVMGFNPRNYGQLTLAEQYGLGTADLSKIRVVGKQIAEVQEKFAPPMHVWRWPDRAGSIKAWDTAYTPPPSPTSGAKARVGIVKADNMDLALNDLKINWDRTFVQSRTKGRKMDVIRVEWSKEGEAYIEQLVREAVRLAGNWPVKKGDVVLIKPNFVTTAFDMFECQARTNPELQAHSTDVRMIRAVAKLAHESGASRILVGEGGRGGADYIGMQQWGVEAMAEDLKKEGIYVELVPFVEQPIRWVKAPFGLANEEYALPEVVVKDVDVLINMPQMKTHTVAGVTLSLKNTSTGLPHAKVYGSPKLALPHLDFAEYTVDINSIRKKEGQGTRMIDYVVMDGLWGAEGDQGCAWGGPGAFPVKLGVIIAGSDPVATDAVATAVMGLDPRNYGHITLAEEYGLGTADLSEIQVVGKQILEVQEKFNVPMHVWRWPSEAGNIKQWDTVFTPPPGPFRAEETR